MKLSFLDWLRIERAITIIELRTQDLPGKSRKAIRRDLRANLRAATAEVGARKAVKRMGSLRRLAADYLDAEYGVGQPRPSWITGLVWAMVVTLVESAVMQSLFVGFIEGVNAADPDGVGLSTYRPFGPSGPGLEYERRPDGLSWLIDVTIWPFLMNIVTFLIAGRTWRLLPIWRRRHRAALAQKQAS